MARNRKNLINAAMAAQQAPGMSRFQRKVTRYQAPTISPLVTTAKRLGLTGKPTKASPTVKRGQALGIIGRPRPGKPHYAGVLKAGR